MTDLVILVADKNMEFGIRGLLSRGPSLGIRAITSDIYVHPERDPGCLLKAHHFLRPFLEDHDHALVMFDLQGCGREALTRQKLETEVEGNLSRSGWADRAACVVIDPELENWVWSDSPQVDRVLGWKGRNPSLRDWLRQQGHSTDDGDKPNRPKEAVEDALRVVRKPRSSALYRELAESVSLERCLDPAFMKLKELLAKWFPRQNMAV